MTDHRKLTYYIWSWEHQAWWRPAKAGYTRRAHEAGKYTYEEAAEIVVGHFPPGEEVAVDQFWFGSQGKPPMYRHTSGG